MEIRGYLLVAETPNNNCEADPNNKPHDMTTDDCSSVRTHLTVIQNLWGCSTMHMCNKWHYTLKIIPAKVL